MISLFFKKKIHILYEKFYNLKKVKEKNNQSILKEDSGSTAITYFPTNRDTISNTKKIWHCLKIPTLIYYENVIFHFIHIKTLRE